MPGRPVRTQLGHAIFLARSHSAFFSACREALNYARVPKQPQSHLHLAVLSAQNWLASHDRSHHDVSSMLAHRGLTDQSRECVVWGFKGDGRLPFQLGDYPIEIERVNRSLTNCWICRLLRRDALASMTSTAWKYGPKDPMRTAEGKVPQVVSPQPSQVRRWSRYSSTIGSILGSSAT